MVTSALHIMQYDCAIYTRSFPLVSGFKDPSLYFISEHEGPGRMTSDTMPVFSSPPAVKPGAITRIAHFMFSEMKTMYMY